MEKIELIQGLTINTKHRKEAHFKHSVFCVTGSGSGIKTVIEARVYQTPNTSYVCVWVHFQSAHSSGSAKAGGYGYDRSAAAIVRAANDMGFQLKEGPNVAAQVENMALQLGLSKDNFKIIEAYG